MCFDYILVLTLDGVGADGSKEDGLVEEGLGAGRGVAHTGLCRKT